jgi:hypothetical protein
MVNSHFPTSRLLVVLFVLGLASSASAQYRYVPPPITPLYPGLVQPLYPTLPSLSVPFVPSVYRPIPLPVPLPAPSTGSTSDLRSGNRYSWTNNSDGSTDVRGSNVYTGSLWRTHIEPNGSMRGTDSDFNPWRYNSSTGTYINYGTGTICIGSGVTRVCS